MKTKEDKLLQVKRIMKKLQKRGQNCEKLNELYRELITDIVLIEDAWGSVKEYEKIKEVLNKLGKESTVKLMFGKKW